MTLIGVACLAGCGARSSLHIPKVARGPALFGFNDSAVPRGQLSVAADIAALRGAGATADRITLDWRQVEPQQGKFDFSAYKPVYRALLNAGIQPIWIPLAAPTWANNLERKCTLPPGDCIYPPDSAHDADWESLIHTLVERFPKSAAIEVWNEENTEFFWQPRPDAGRYGRLLAEAARAVRGRLPLLVGGLAGVEFTDTQSISVPDFLNALRPREAAAAGVALHVYPTLRGVTAALQGYLSQVRTLWPGKPLWLTELGFSTSGPDSVTETDQAQGLLTAYQVLEREHDVKGIFFHTLFAPAGPAANRESGYGVLRPDGRPRAAFCALAAVRGTGYKC